MLLWLDDIRQAPDGWTWAKTVPTAIEYLRNNEVSEASLDHDLGATDPEHTGYDLAVWLEQHPQYMPNKITIHSWNPVGARRMAIALRECPELLIREADSL